MKASQHARTKPLKSSGLGSLSLPDEVFVWRRQLVHDTLRAAVIFSTLALIAGSIYAFISKSYWVIPLYALAYIGILLVTFLKRIPYWVQASTLIGLVYFVGVLDLIDSGRGGDGRVLLLAVPALAGLMFGRREGILALVVDVVTLLVFGWAYSSHLLSIPIEKQANTANPAAWLSNTIVLLMLGSLLVASQSFLVPRLALALKHSRKVVKELDSAQYTLREQAEGLKEANRMLSKRTQVLEATAQLAREAVSVSDMQEMLDKVVRLVGEHFDYYHAGVFLINPSKEWADLKAASSEGGKRMLARAHRLRVNQEGIVGYVTGKGEARIALDVGSDAVYFDNPDLPDTRSEMALPLRVHNEIIGALDVQSTEPNAFSEDDVGLLQIIADQVSMLVSNLQLYQQAQENLEAERNIYRTISQAKWQELLRSRPMSGYVCNEDGTFPLTSVAQAPVPGDDRLQVVKIPIQLRGQVLGAVEARKAMDQSWTKEEVHMMETLVDQLSTALESARLFQETQRRAERERLAGEITAKVRASNDPQTIMQTAVRELRQALQANRVQVLVQSENTKPASMNSQGNGESHLGE